ncbi:MAG: NAD-dependent epimerase [Spirochaetales bacterium]
MKILVTGSAGFIGFHLSKRLIAEGHSVLGLDCLNEYYDVGLKYSRLSVLGIDRTEISDGTVVASSAEARFQFVQADLGAVGLLERLFAEQCFDAVVNLAAQAGVRYSLINPREYIQSNVSGFLNVLECCRHFGTKHLVYASSSSVYGLNESLPFSTSDSVDHPVSLYAASKKSNELMAHSYSHLFGLPTTGLRFFTVYGPWGRPDMALFLFTKAILEGRSIDVFNNGEMYRDFTYIEDIVDGIVRVIRNPAEPDKKWNAKKPNPASSPAPYKIFNIGNSTSVRLMDFIRAIEHELGQNAKLNLLPLQPGDVAATWSDISDLSDSLGYKPRTSIEEGVRHFIRWYREYYRV